MGHAPAGHTFTFTGPLHAAAAAALAAEHHGFRIRHPKADPRTNLATFTAVLASEVRWLQLLAIVELLARADEPDPVAVAAHTPSR